MLTGAKSSLSYRIDSEWYLPTFMPYSTMDDSITGLGNQWRNASFIGGGIICAAML